MLKEYLEEPVAALPPAIAAMLPRISILLVPYLERSGERGAPKAGRKPRPALEKISDFVVGERPAEGRQSWASQISFENETVLLFALKEQDVAEYHYRLYRRLAALVADKWSTQAASSYKTMIREELMASVHGEVDDESWQAKQTLLRHQSNVKRDSAALRRLRPSILHRYSDALFAWHLLRHRCRDRPAPVAQPLSAQALARIERALSATFRLFGLPGRWGERQIRQSLKNFQSALFTTAADSRRREREACVGSTERAGAEVPASPAPGAGNVRKYGLRFIALSYLFIVLF